MVLTCVSRCRASYWMGILAPARWTGRRCTDEFQALAPDVDQAVEKFRQGGEQHRLVAEIVDVPPRRTTVC